MYRERGTGEQDIVVRIVVRPFTVAMTCTFVKADWPVCEPLAEVTEGGVIQPRRRSGRARSCNTVVAWMIVAACTGR